MAKKAVKKSTKPAGAAAFMPKYDQPLPSYSAYAQHRILLEKFGTDAAGQAKVLKHGVDVLGLPESQVKTYIREKLNAIKRDEQKALGLHPTTPQLEKAKRGDFEPDFKHKTRDAAKSHILAIVRRSGAHDSAFHILSEDGMYAVVPAHVKPDGKPTPLKKGDVVMDTTMKDSRAEVIEGGAEQSTVRYLTERSYLPKEAHISNYYLYKLGAKEAAEAKAAASKPLKAAVEKLATAGKIARQKPEAKKPAAKKAAKKAK